jgi:hypothetical protein
MEWEVMFIENNANQIKGVLECYDRINIKCVAGQFGYAGGMGNFFDMLGAKYFSFCEMFKSTTEMIVANAEALAKVNNIGIEFIRSPRRYGRKDEKIDAILEQRGYHEGLVKIWSQLETINTYRAWTDKTTNKTSFRTGTTNCKVYYFYFIDRTLGLCFVKVPTAAPFISTIYFNGHNWLEKKLQKAGIKHQKVENAFTYIEDFNKAQKICDGFRVDDIKQALDILISRCCPLPKEWDLNWFYTISQCEFALDIVFKEQDVLKPIYDNIVKTAMHTITPENIATFLGKRLTVKFEGEMGSRYSERVLGTRIKCQMGALSVKTYDKFGKILRIEVTTLDVSQINLFRDVFKRNGEIDHKAAPAKKDVFSLFSLITPFKNIIQRYLEFISAFDDPSDGIKKLNEVTGKKQVNGKNVKGINFFDKTDMKILNSISAPELVLNGFRCKYLKSAFPEFKDKPWRITCILKRLRNLKIIVKTSNASKYYFSELGKKIAVAGMHIINQLLTPALASV